MQAVTEITEEMSSTTEGRPKKKVFVAGATGSTGKRIVDQLLAKGFAVKAGVRDLEKAKSFFPSDSPSLELVSFTLPPLFLHFHSSCSLHFPGDVCL